MEKSSREADEGLPGLVYFDGSGFNLRKKIVYAWQKRGERIIVPVTRGKSQNVLGFMGHRYQEFTSFVFEGTIDLHVITGCFDIFAETLERETVVVIDNAMTHRSQKFQEKIKEWEKLGFESIFLAELLSDAQ